MSAAYRQLCESLPERSPAGASSFPVDSRQVKAWVDALPRANQQATLQKLLEAFTTLRGQRIDGAQRLQVLDALRPAALEAIELLDRQLKASSFPLTPQRAQAADTCMNLHRELALGYRTAVAEATAPAGSVPFLRGGAIASGIVRGLLHHARLLSMSYFLYRLPPDGTWLGLHSLYRFADHAKLKDKSVDEPGEPGAVTAGLLYTQALLLALSNPYRFAQREQDDLHPLTRALALQIHPSEQRRGGALLAIPLDADRGPGYIPEEREGEDEARLWLDLQPLRDLLEQPLKAGDDSVSLKLRGRREPLVAPADLLRRLRAGWGTAAERRSTRLDAEHKLQTVIGLSGLHFYLAGEQDFDSFMREVRGVGVQETERASWAHGNSDAVRAGLTRARVLDQSLGGYRLLWTREETVRIRVGELIGLAVGHDRQLLDWMVGVVRWLRYHDDGSVDAGVELLARRARAVGLRTLDLVGSPKNPLRGIEVEWLRRKEADGRRYLLAPAQLDSSANRIEVARAVDDAELESDDAQVIHFRDLVVVENAGDYLLVSAAPVETLPE